MKPNDTNRLAHTTWNCKYHIVFAPKNRKKVFYGENREDIEGTMQLGAGKNCRSGSMSRSYSHTGGDTAENERFRFRRVSQGEKQSNHLRATRQSKVQIWQSAVLASRVLR